MGISNIINNNIGSKANRVIKKIKFIFYRVILSKLQSIMDEALVSTFSLVLYDACLLYKLYSKTFNQNFVIEELESLDSEYLRKSP